MANGRQPPLPDHGPPPQGGLGPADPLYYVAESLHSLRQHNQMMLLITQDQQRLTEAQRRLDEAECRSKLLKRSRTDWLLEESGRIDRCEGKPQDKFRNWLRGMNAAMLRMPDKTPPPLTVLITHEQLKENGHENW